MSLENSEALGQWLLILVFILGMVYLVIQIVKAMKHDPPLSSTYTPIRDHQELADRVHRHERDTEQRFQKVYEDHARNQESLMHLIRCTREEVSGLSTASDIHGQQLNSMNTKLDKLVEQKAAKNHAQ